MPSLTTASQENTEATVKSRAEKTVLRIGLEMCSSRGGSACRSDLITNHLSAVGVHQAGFSWAWGNLFSCADFKTDLVVLAFVGNPALSATFCTDQLHADTLLPE